jgi:predicted ribosome quality control (RQC) complex YloA/Tae2 family protein
METRSRRDAEPDRATLVVRVLSRYRAKLARKLEAQRGDLAEAERGVEFRRFGETLLTYLGQITAHTERVVLPDPADPAHNLEIALDPRLKPQENAARYFRRAARAERGLIEIPPRIAAVEAQLRALEHLLERAERAEEHAPLPEGDSRALVSHDPTLERDLEETLKKLPPVHRKGIGVAPSRAAGAGAAGAGGAPSAEKRGPPARLMPRRLKTREGWDVMIGRSNEGNDYLTHQLARPEDYWFHVHGAAGSHVVLRRGKGKNEPSKQTIEEVAAWAAFYSQARTAGKVSVIVTRKKYVRKPRKAPPGLAMCEREKTVMVRPKEPAKGTMADAEGGADGVERPRIP